MGTGKYSKKKGRGNQSKVLWIALAVAVLLLLVTWIATILVTDNSEEAIPEQTLPLVDTAPTAVQTQPKEQTLPEEELTDPPEVTENVTEPTEPHTETVPKQNGNSGSSSPSNGQINTPQPTQPPKTVLKLPYTIPGTDLVVQYVANYDGIYLEDGGNTEVSGVAMMALYNSGSEAVEYVNITMKYDDKTLEFVASAIPANGTIAVQEANQKSCATGDLTACTADIATRAELEMSSDMVSVVDNGNNSLTVTNLTDEEIVTIRLFYKYYMEDAKVYVGGITYTAKLSNLKAGESITITPSHYASGSCIIVMVRTYDTDA